MRQGSDARAISRRAEIEAERPIYPRPIAYKTEADLKVGLYVRTITFAYGDYRG
jgi:hypothetical protein